MVLTPEATEAKQIAAIVKRVQTTNRSIASGKIDWKRLYTYLTDHCSMIAVQLIHEAIEVNDDSFLRLMNAAAGGPNIKDTTGGSTIALVYQPYIHSHLGPAGEFLHLNQAARRAYRCLIGTYPAKGWELINESHRTQQQVKKLVEVYCCVATEDSPTSMDPSLLDALLDDSRSDHEKIINLIRVNPRLSLGQLEDTLSHGSLPLVSGML